VKQVVWLGDSLKRVRDFAPEARYEAGVQLGLVQVGEAVGLEADAFGRPWRERNSRPYRRCVSGDLHGEVYGGGIRAACVSKEVSRDRADGHRVGAPKIPRAYTGEKATMSGKLRRVLGSDNIFIDLGFDKVEAENLKMRSDLMIRIVEFHRKSGMTQAAAAKALGLTQPRLNALLKGKIGQFSLDALVNIASRAGMNVQLVVKKAA